MFTPPWLPCPLRVGRPCLSYRAAAEQPRPPPPVFPGLEKDRRVAAKSRSSDTNTSMTCPHWSIA
jgi:hypothetical protein